MSTNAKKIPPEVIKNIWSYIPNTPTHKYSPGQDVEALQGDTWVSAHIVNPNADGTYTIIIGNKKPESSWFRWPENNLRGESKPFMVPHNNINSEELNGYLYTWFEQIIGKDLSSDKRIQSFIDFVKNRDEYLPVDGDDVIISEYAKKNVPVLFEDIYEAGGNRQRRSKKRTSKKRTSKKRSSKKRSSKKRSSKKLRSKKLGRKLKGG